MHENCDRTVSKIELNLTRLDLHGLELLDFWACKQTKHCLHLHCAAHYFHTKSTLGVKTQPNTAKFSEVLDLLPPLPMVTQFMAVIHCCFVMIIFALKLKDLFCR